MLNELALDEVKAVSLPAYRLAAMRHKGPYPEIGEAFERVDKWACTRGIFSQGRPLLIACYYDNPDTVPAKDLRSDAGVVVEEDVEVDGDAHMVELPAGRYAVGRFEVDYDGFLPAWAKVYEWVATQGLPLDYERPSFERYIKMCYEHPEKKFIIDVCVALQD